MQNITTIYRFNTPFLDKDKEINQINLILDKIKTSLKFESLLFIEKKKIVWDYYKITLEFQDNLWKIDLFYVNEIWEYYLPIFELDIFLNNTFLINDTNKKRAVKFLTNIFESFDWLNEKEYLIDIDKNLYYKWFLKRKIYPHYDFTNIVIIQKEFENKKWMKLLENFIINFNNKNFILKKENSKEYHKIHSLLLYFIYLVFIMHENIININKTQKWLNNIYVWYYDAHKKHMEQRLSFLWDLNIVIFKEYKEKLELLFKLFS